MSQIRRKNFIHIVETYPNQEVLAIQIGTTSGYVSQLVTGNRNIGEKKARDIERCLGLPENYLDLKNNKYGDAQDNNEITSNIISGPFIKGRVPLINTVQAGQWREIIENFEPDEWIETTIQVSHRSFALRVVGDSMTNPFGAPSIPEGYIIIVDPMIEPKNGSFVIARLEHSNEALFKQLVIDGPHKYLKSLNPNYKPIPIDENCTIVGVVKKSQFDL